MGIEDNKDWGTTENTANGNAAGKKENVGGGILSEMLGVSSLFSGGRDMKEVDEVIRITTAKIKSLNNDTLIPVHRAILPDIVGLTRQIAQSLPGLCLSKVIGGVCYLMPVLFINSQIAHSMDSFDIVGSQVNQKVSMPTLPVDYYNKEIIDNVMAHYKALGKSKNFNGVQIVTAKLIDLDMLKADETLLQNNAMAELISKLVFTEWYEGLMVTMVHQAGSTNAKMGTPFAEGKAYGNSGHALVRTEAIPTPIVDNGIVTGYNLIARVVTTNPSNNAHQTNSKSVVEATATVQLMGGSIASFRQDPENFKNGHFLNQATGFPFGYYPFSPLIIMGEAKPGDQMLDNSGLHSYFMGLYALLCTNNNYLFAEPFRMANVGSRGNLSDMENRISTLVQEQGAVMTRDANNAMTDKKVKDSDFSNGWIQKHIGPHAVFAVDLINFGTSAAINNFLFKLTGNNTSDTTVAECIRTVVAVIDSMTNGKMSEVVSDNIKTNSGWTPKIPILHSTNVIVPCGTFRHGQKWVDMSEIDEMFLSHVYKQDQTKVISYLSLMYGTDASMDARTRKHLIRQRLSEITDGSFHLNGFKNRSYINPNFNAAFSKAMDTIGSLQVGGTMGTFATTPTGYAPGANLVTTTAAGSYAGVVSGTGTVNNVGVLTFGALSR